MVVSRPSSLKAVALALFLTGCGGDRDEAVVPSMQSGTGQGEGASDGGSAALRFTDVSSASGLTLVNVSGDPRKKLAIPENIGQGAAALDFDGDGWLDLFVANGDAFEGTEAPDERRCALYRGRGDLTFEDVTEGAGLLFDAWCHGVNAVDFDADGHPDLYVTVYLGPNKFFRNRGDGTFEERKEWGGRDPGPSTASAFFDADGDGDLDLYVGNYVDYDPDNPPNDGQPCEWKGLSVSCGPKGTPPGADTFWRNEGGKLVNAPESTAAFGLDKVNASWTLGCVTLDLDADGDLDLYVANDSGPNYCFRNLGGGRFEECGFALGLDRNEDGREQAGMGVDCGDLDNDGLFDLFVTNFSHDSNSVYQAFRTADDRVLFEDVAYSVGIGQGSYQFLSWGTAITDLDADGWQDLVIASGHVYPQVDSAAVGTTYRQRNQVFRSLGVGAGGLRFEEFVPAAGDGFRKESCSRGLICADFDHDGDRDIFVLELDDVPTLLRNDSKAGHWIGLLLVGSGSNRDSIGARVAVTDAADVVRWRERSSGAGYLSSADPRLHFGLGEAGGPVKIEVRWPSGARGVWQGLASGEYWVLTEGVAEASQLQTP